MSIRFAIVVLACFLVLSGAGSTASALGLKTAPLEYKTTLKKNERKKGFIDVSNPTGQSIKVSTDVQAFEQIDDKGGLKFFDDKEISLGIKTDLKSFTLGPRQALRMYFQIDGRNLPKGDIFAAIFFTTEPKSPENGVGQLVRVGTLFSIVNQTPGSREADITNLDVPFIQIGNDINGTYRIKNTAGKNTRSGFYPEVTIEKSFGKSFKRESSLVTAGRTRENQFKYPESGIGIHQITVEYGESKQSRWTITVTPFVLVVILLIGFIIVVEIILFRRRRKKTPPPLKKN